MSQLRRRIFGVGGGDDSSESSREQSPAPAPENAGGEAYRIIPKETLEKLKKGGPKKGSKRRHAWVFVLGGLFGLFIAGFFASSSGGLDKLVTMAGLEDMNLDSILDVLPAGLIREVRDLQVCKYGCVRQHRADVDEGRAYSLVRKMLSTTIPLPSACMLAPKVFVRNIL